MLTQTIYFNSEGTGYSHYCAYGCRIRGYEAYYFLFFTDQGKEKVNAYCLSCAEHEKKGMIVVRN